jgi:hypothetical protein
MRLAVLTTWSSLIQHNSFLVLTGFYPTLNFGFIPPVSNSTVRVHLRELLDAKRLNDNSKAFERDEFL